jgi:hypothetical protein
VPRRRIPHAAVTCLASISASSTRGEQWSPAIRDRGSSFVKNSFPGIWAKSVLASYPAWCCLEKTGEDGDENTEISSCLPRGVSTDESFNTVSRSAIRLDRPSHTLLHTRARPHRNTRPTNMGLLTVVEDRPTPKAVYNWRVWACACVASFASCMIGYDR